MFGKNGLIKKLLDSHTQKYTQEEIRERIEAKIVSTVEKETALGNDITVASILQELVEEGIFESIDKAENIGNIEGYEVKLKQNEEDIVIESIKEATNVRITYKLDPKGYTNSDKVAILFKVEGKVKSITKPDGLAIYTDRDTIAIDYEVYKNGRYQFIVENEDGTSITKDVIVDTIDKLPPLDFEIITKLDGNKLTILHEVKDSDTTEESVCSGIDRYEYFIKALGENSYTLYNTNEIENLILGTYSVYVVAYDKAGNYTSSSVKTVFPSSTILYNSNQPDISQWDFSVQRDVKYGISDDKWMYLNGFINGVGGGPYYTEGRVTTKQFYDLAQYNTLTITIQSYIPYNLFIGIVDENEEWIVQKTPDKNGDLIFDLKDINKSGKIRIEINGSIIYISKIILE